MGLGGARQPREPILSATELSVHTYVYTHTHTHECLYPLGPQSQLCSFYHFSSLPTNKGKVKLTFVCTSLVTGKWSFSCRCFSPICLCGLSVLGTSCCWDIRGTAYWSPRACHIRAFHVTFLLVRIFFPSVMHHLNIDCQIPPFLCSWCLLHPRIGLLFCLNTIQLLTSVF